MAEKSTMMVTGTITVEYDPTQTSLAVTAEIVNLGDTANPVGP